MADWNPAEMIGNKPSTLSMSLYSELITDLVWALQRKNYGYNDLSAHPLMLNFGGSPYIDLRVDFNSFLPEKLDKSIKEKSIYNPTLIGKLEKIVASLFHKELKVKNCLTNI